jgi:hypothetical protein
VVFREGIHRGPTSAGLVVSPQAVAAGVATRNKTDECLIPTAQRRPVLKTLRAFVQDRLAVHYGPTNLPPAHTASEVFLTR